MDSIFLIDLLLAAATLVLIIILIYYQVWKINWLQHHGRRIIATITAIRHEKKKTSTGAVRDFAYVTARWTDPRTGQTYTFWKWLVDNHVSYTTGYLVPILIDPRHPRRYQMEI